MIYTEMTNKAMNLAYAAHHGQLDRSGIPYVLHPFHLAEQMETEETVIVALLHDVVEDTEYTLEDLRQMGFPDSVMDALALITHDPSVPYLDYVERLKSDPIARAVKLADLTHNSDLSRFPVVTEKDLERLKKYKEAMIILKQGE